MILKCFTIVVYNVHTSPVASTTPHNSNPVTGREHRYIEPQTSSIQTFSHIELKLSWSWVEFSYLHSVQRQEYTHKFPYRSPVAQKIKDKLVLSTLDKAMAAWLIKS